ncbi:MAG: hypothetical protein IPL61_31510 [Myxococcales bacterium]|nr:hypothetical protein [Myxococcales bacterium]
MRPVAVVALLASLSGCLYSRNALERHGDGYRNYPATVAAEQARRHDRRRLALLGGPLEVIVGAGLAALVLYAPIKNTSDSESVTDQLGDAGKELAGRALLGTVGLAVAMSGVGDLVLGATDGLFASPIVRDGALVPADQIDALAPAPGPRLTFHGVQLVSDREIGTGLGLGVALWPTARLRARAAVTGELTLGWRDRSTHGGLVGELALERAFGRERVGLYPRAALGAYVAGGWSRADADRPVVRAGLLGTVRAMQLRLGAGYQPGDRRPSIEFAIQRELRVD